MPEGPPRRDPLRPLLAVGTCFLLLQVALWFLVPIFDFIGGRMVAITVSILIAAAVSSALTMAIFEGRSLIHLGLEWNDGVLRNLGTGFALGIGAAALSVVPAVFAGLAFFRLLPAADVPVRGAAFLVALLFCGAIGEELAFRGFVLQYLVRGYGKWIALIASGALFGWLHKDNPGASSLSMFNTALFGVLFGFAVLRSHDLWLSTGLHFGWNATLPFLGVELSGLTIKVARYELVWKVGDLWSGGKYGPEAGLIATLVLGLLFLGVWKLPVHRSSAYLLEPSSA